MSQALEKKIRKHRDWSQRFSGLFAKQKPLKLPALGGPKGLDSKSAIHAREQSIPRVATNRVFVRDLSQRFSGSFTWGKPRKQLALSEPKGSTPKAQSMPASNLVAVSFFLVVGLWVTACAASPLKGSDLGKTPAPTFALNDHRGAPVALADLRGKVVVLTFLYTHCPDECPLIADRMRAAADQLGDAMNNVAYVAISTDPANDTPIAVQSFLQTHRLDGRLRYLVGTAEQLTPVWSAYFIAAQPSPLRQNKFLVSHSTRVVVIDQAGNQRINLDSDFDPADLVFDLRTLMAE